MKKEFYIVCRVLVTAKQDILTASVADKGNLAPNGFSDGTGAPARVQHSVTDFD